MALIKSISGIRGTIGGKVGSNLTPIDVVKFAAAYGTWLQQQHAGIALTVVVGRDARISGSMVNQLVIATLNGLGINVIDAGLSTTPTVEMGVVTEQANGGIIITASHNPKEWNALKLLNHKGEFISAIDGETILAIAENERYNFTDVNTIGTTIYNDTLIAKHIDAILALPLVNVTAIKKTNFKIAIDCVNSTGGIAYHNCWLHLVLKPCTNYILNLTDSFRITQSHYPKTYET